MLYVEILLFLTLQRLHHGFTARTSPLHARWFTWQLHATRYMLQPLPTDSQLTTNRFPQVIFLQTKQKTLTAWPGFEFLIEWSQRPDSDRRPAHYECAALPTELRWPLKYWRSQRDSNSCRSLERAVS